MKTIVLVACVSRKGDKRAKAKDLYKGPLFTSSLNYAYSLKPTKIFILSALHYLLQLDREIEPYDVTLSNVPKSKRKPELKVLDAKEKKEWGEKVAAMLSKHSNLNKDNFIFLAGQEYIKPLKDKLKKYQNPLEGVRLFDRPSFLKNRTNGD